MSEAGCTSACVQLNLVLYFLNTNTKEGTPQAQLGGPARMGKGFRDCGVRGVWVVREGFKEEADLWWGLRGGAGKHK